MQEEFKVGDWVSTPHRGVWQITHEIELSAWEIALGGRAKLWKPELHEWVWGISCHGVPTLGQYVGSIHELASGRRQIRMSPTNCICNFIDIQPFIGELPTNLKEPQ